MVSIPRATIDATPEFVTDALRSGGTIGADTRVAEVEHCTIGEGVGVMGTLARLTLRFSGPAVRAPSSVIIKLPSEFPESRGVGNHFRLYEREGRFYEQLGDKLSVRTPHCYFNHVDLEGDEFALLLEDFAGRTMVSQLEGISPDRAAEVIRTIATVHAEWWASPALDSLTWMPDIEAPEVTTAGEHYRIYWPKLLELVGDELPDGSVELGGLIGSAWEETQATFGKLNPVTLCHGDLRADNLMFDDSAEGQERVGLLDWQVSARLGGLWDIAYLLTQSMTVENRRSADRDLISLWYDLITSALGSSPNGFTLDDAWREYRRAAGNLTVYMVVAGANADFSIERIRQLVSAGAERSFTAALDLDSASLLGS